MTKVITQRLTLCGPAVMTNSGWGPPARAAFPRTRRFTSCTSRSDKKQLLQMSRVHPAPHPSLHTPFLPLRNAIWTDTCRPLQYLKKVSRSLRAKSLVRQRGATRWFNVDKGDKRCWMFGYFHFAMKYLNDKKKLKMLKKRKKIKKNKTLT